MSQSPENASQQDARGASSLKVRRRNRMITSCLECRRRKLRCDKQSPCTNCTKFSRECNFLAPALDSVSQQKLNELKDKMGSLERTLEDDVARRGSTKSRAHEERKTSIDLPGEESSTDGEGPVPDDEKALEPTPLAVVDASYDDDANDDVLDLGIRVGKMRMTERLGGYFRPKMSEELAYTLQNPETDHRTAEEKTLLPQLLDDAHDFLEPGSTYIAPGSGFLFGDVGSKRDLINFLPSKAVGDQLITLYYENVHFVARVVHWPSFRLQYENFWTVVLAGVEPPASQQALVLGIMFSAIASMSESDVNAVFGRPKQIVQANFQKGTEVALSKAQFLRTTKIETLQALIVLLIPMCRDQMSRAHSVLVGTAIRLGECMGLHRDPADVYGLGPLDCQVRRTLWFQLCFLDFRTGEIQGPRPCVKREDYDTKFPLNIDDADLLAGKSEETNSRFTDMTLSRIRFECNEMHRIIWYDRQRLEKKRITLTHLLGKIESFRKAMEAKYTPILDPSIPIHHYAKTCLTLLLMRMHIMVLHRYMNNASNKLPDRLRQIIISSGTAQVEAAVELESDPTLQKWKWYNGTHQQWHTALLLLTEVYAHPQRREADRIWKVIDFVFEPDPSHSRAQKGRTIMNAVRDRTAVYRDLRRMRAPVSMRNEDVRRIYRMGLIAPSKQYQAIPAKKLPPASSYDEPTDMQSTTDSSQPKVTNTQDAQHSWGFDDAQTLLFNGNFANKPLSQLPGWGTKQQTDFDTSPFHHRGSSLPQVDYSSPSEGSGIQEAWPPFINNNQIHWQPSQQTGTSPPFQHSRIPGGEPAPSNGPPAQPFGYTSFAPVSRSTPSDDSMMLDIDWVRAKFSETGNANNLLE